MLLVGLREGELRSLYSGYAFRASAMQENKNTSKNTLFSIQRND